MEEEKEEEDEEGEGEVKKLTKKLKPWWARD